jgi:hypothetical protein
MLIVPIGLQAFVLTPFPGASGPGPSSRTLSRDFAVVVAQTAPAAIF